ncbi:prophage MuSo1, transcriptional regulator, Cro/CI family [plant metagenome]|uniref:Prophage MuSo1, transcriptional regulator, Cro/CI family n=1 Tax=plant metagenome TaxID=1297885 RepID=A0A484U355_9ZZZZ
MAPTFADGDQLLVDRGVREINVDAVFVLSRYNELFIKRVQRRLKDGAIVIKADNPLFEPETIENGERDALDVLGRVVWVWRGAKL